MMKRLRGAAIAMCGLCIAAPRLAGGQVIAGRVVDAASGSGVPGARVTAVSGDRRESRQTLTGADGRYTIVVGGGAYRVQVARTGYQPARTGLHSVGPGDTVRVDVRVAVSPRQLAGVTATTRPQRLPMSGGFMQKYPTDSLLAAERTRVEGGRGRVVVRGVMLTPNPCWRLAGAADRVGPLVTLNIQARFVDEFCPPDAVGASTYKISLRRIPAGTYTVRVLHTYLGNAYKPGVAIDSSGVTVR